TRPAIFFCAAYGGDFSTRAATPSGLDGAGGRGERGVKAGRREAVPDRRPRVQCGRARRKGPLGRRGWGEPLPPRSHGPHVYLFQLFALDQASGLPASFTLDDAVTAITGHAIGRARLDGTYEIR
ncbi:MAG: hypothetical protein ACRDNS_22010, partial [Trebonia sp.]